MGRTQMPEPSEVLPGRDTEMTVPETHAVLGTPLRPPFPADWRTAMFALGCFWGAERVFWQTPGVRTTAVGYAGGATPNPTYEEVCSGRTGHAETVFVAYDPSAVSFEDLCRVFFQSHDPTQGMRQGNDVGTQYRSVLFVGSPEEKAVAERVARAYGEALRAAGYGRITTEIVSAGPFYYAEPYHQQYLAKNPGGYCGLGGTGVACPSGLALDAGASGGGGTRLSAR